MNRCKECLQPDTRPNIWFKDGICGACWNYKARDTIDWNDRAEKLKAIFEWSREQDAVYDCVIGVSGGRDSLYQALFAKRHGLNALLVTSPPVMATEVGKRNMQNLLDKSGFPLISLTPGADIVRDAVRKGFEENLNPVKYTEHCLWASAYIVADRFNIPLVIQGENPNITLGLKGDTSGDALSIMSHDTLTGEIDDFFFKIPYYDGAAIWLNYYDRGWGWSSNTKFAVRNGLLPYPGHYPTMRGRISPYVSIDSDLQAVNQYLKFKKLGFGFVTDEVGYYIREGIYTKEQGEKVIADYDGRCGSGYITLFCRYLGITNDYFEEVVARHTGKSV